MSRSLPRLLAAACLAAACQASTNRPGFLPLPDASILEVQLPRQEATRLLAEELRGDSFPLARVELLDGYLESEWFGYPGFTTVSTVTLNPSVSRLRAWVDPGKQGPPTTSMVTVELAYRQYVDPGRSPREAERLVGETHSARQLAVAAVRRLIARFGGDSGVADTSARARPDTTRIPPR